MNEALLARTKLKPPEFRRLQARSWTIRLQQNLKKANSAAVVRGALDEINFEERLNGDS